MEPLSLTARTPPKMQALIAKRRPIARIHPPTFFKPPVNAPPSLWTGVEGVAGVGAGAGARRGPAAIRSAFAIAPSTSVLNSDKGEEFLAYWNEVDANVEDYQCHPGEFDISRPGGSFRYRPDALRQLIDGSIELIEVKRTPDDLDDDLRDKLGDVREVARRCGWRFRVLYDDDIFGVGRHQRRVRKRTVEGIFSRRSLSLTKSQKKVAGQIVGRGEAITWKDLGERLAPGDTLSAYAAIECLLARGFLVTDLDVPFGNRTMLQPIRPRRRASMIRL